MMIVKYCHECGHKLTLGTEKHCPECGVKLKSAAGGSSNEFDRDNSSLIDIGNTQGDIIGTGFRGFGNVVGKEIGYTVNGNVIYLQVTGNTSSESLDNLQKIINTPTKVERNTLANSEITPSTTKEDIKKMEESGETYRQIKNILNEVGKIEEKTGRKIEEIKAGNLQISKNELSLKEYLLKGNEHYYKKEYKEAV